MQQDLSRTDFLIEIETYNRIQRTANSIDNIASRLSVAEQEPNQFLIHFCLGLVGFVVCAGSGFTCRVNATSVFSGQVYCDPFSVWRGCLGNTRRPGSRSCALVLIVSVWRILPLPSGPHSSVTRDGASGSAGTGRPIPL